MTIQPPTETTASEVSLFLEAPEDAQFLVLSHSSLEAEDLCRVRMVCRDMRDVIDSPAHNPIWRCLSIRKGLRPMTAQEQTSQTYQEYFHRYWTCLQLKNWPLIELQTGRVQLYVNGKTNPRFIALLKSATRAGHQVVACQVLEVFEESMNFPLIKTALTVAAEANRTELASKALQLLSKEKSYIDVNDALKTAILKGHTDIFTQLIAFMPTNDFFPPSTWDNLLIIAVTCGHTEIVKLILDNFINMIEPRTIDHALEAARRSGHHALAELLSQHATDEARLSKRHELVPFNPNGFFSTVCKFLSTKRVGLVADVISKLQQIQYLKQLSPEQLKGLLLLGLDNKFPELTEFLLNNEIFRPMILSNKLMIHAVVGQFADRPFEFRVETIVEFFKELHSVVCSSENNAPNQEISKKPDLELYYLQLSRVLLSGVEKGNLELVRALVSQIEPKIPDDLARLFVIASQTRDLIPLLTVCLECPEMSWFISNLPKQIVEKIQKDRLNKLEQLLKEKQATQPGQ